MRKNQSNLLDGNIIYDIFKQQSQITINGKLYVVNRHFVSSRHYKDAVFTVIKNDEKRVLYGTSKIC